MSGRKYAVKSMPLLKDKHPPHSKRLTTIVKEKYDG